MENEYALNLAQGPAKVMALAKTIMNKGLTMDFDDVLEYEAYSQLVCRRTKDHKQGGRAFMEKRPPRFMGE